MVKTHAKTKQKLLAKKITGGVGSFYVLDSNNEKIPSGYNVRGERSYRVAVCLVKNVM